MINKFAFEGDTLEDFYTALSSALRLSFRPGRNPLPEFHNLEIVLPAKSKSYWIMEQEEHEGATLACIVRSPYTRLEHETFVMDFGPEPEDFSKRGEYLAETVGVLDKPKSDRLRWTKASYEKVEARIREILSTTKLEAKCPRWMDDGDGTASKDGLGFFLRNEPGEAMYIYKTWVYYGK